ncbi:MAG: SRPBCC family protein [Gaiellales bacterium]
MTVDHDDPRVATFSTAADRAIRVERIFDAPRERVYAVFNDPALIPEWWGPNPAEVDRMDVRPGGAWRYVMAGPDGVRMGFRGTYREVTPPERVVRTFEWEGMPGHIAVESASFEDLGDRTRVITTMLFHTTEERDGMFESGMQRGLNATYRRLDEVLAKAVAPARG